MKVFYKIIFSLLAAVFVSSEKARFDNYRVYSVNIDNKLQLSVLRELEETSDSYSFLEFNSQIGGIAEIVVPPHQFAHFGELVEKFEFKMSLKHENLQEVMDKTQPRRQRKAEGDMNWEDYQTLDTIYEWLGFLQRDFPEWISVEDIGLSYEGRPIKVVKLSKKENNRAIFIEAQIHAREWIAGATATYILNEFLYSTDPEIQELSLNIDWYIIPNANPDGYVYTWTSNRNWRKTRSAVSLTCDGVDGNRNFGYNFLKADEDGNLGASKIPCSDNYAGSHAFSEPEALAIDNYISKIYDKFDIYLSFHSSGHVLIYPYGHTSVQVDNVDELQAIGEAAAERLYTVDNIQYRVGNSRLIFYPTSGISVDHMYGAYNISIGYTYEMRGRGDYGNFGHFLPPQFILPNAEEILQSLIGMVQKTREYGKLIVSP